MPTVLRRDTASGDMAGFCIVMAGVLMTMLSASAPSPFYPVLQRQIGFSPAVLSGIFAVYALVLLATLLTLGSISDHIGRRPVLSAGFVLLALAAFWFEAAGSVAGLTGARALQGVAGGLLLSTLSATLVDLEPPSMPGAAPIGNSVLPMIGLAVGALAAGLALDDLADPRLDIFGGLVGMGSLALAFAVWTFRETAPMHDLTLGALRPRLGLPATARTAFWQGAPAIVAGWATGGLYLSLGAPIVARVFGLETSTQQGAVLAWLAGVGALACFAVRSRHARSILLFGTAALGTGTALGMVGIAVGSLPVYLVGLTLVGAGFGTCFYAVIRTLVPLVAAEHRSQLFASLYTLSYLAFGIPAVIAGLAVPVIGLTATALIYGSGIVVLSAAAWALRRFGAAD